MRLLRKSMFIQIDRHNLILKNGGKWTFFYETKASIHLSQWGEWVYGAQSWKQGRFVFIRIDRQTLILKMVERDVFSYET